MAKDVVTYWYIKALNEVTQRSIADFLARSGGVETHEVLELKVKGERPQSVWQVEYEVIAKLQRSDRDWARFRVFHRKENEDEAREWTYHRKRHLAAETIKLKNDAMLLRTRLKKGGVNDDK